MADSVRQKIVDAVKTRFQGILTSGGYETNAGSNVSVWRDMRNVPITSDEFPAIVLMDKRCEIDRENEPLRIHAFKLTMIADVYAGLDDAAETVRKVIADIHKAIGVDEQWTVSGTKLALMTEPVIDDMGIEQDENIIAAARVAFVITFRQLRWNPYQQN